MNLPREPDEEPVDLARDPMEPGAISVDRDASRSAPRRPGWVGWAVGVGVLVLVVGGFFGAKALSAKKASASVSTGASTPAVGGGFSGPGGRPDTFGTIASIAGNALTVQDAASNTAVKVETSNATRVTVAKSVAVSSIASGDRISVTGATSGSTITATRITDMGPVSTTSPPRGVGVTRPPGGSGRAGFGPGGPGGASAGGFASGTVTGVSGDSIVISTHSGHNVTVRTSASTTVTKNETATLNALQVGESVRVSGTTSSDGSVVATSISEGAGSGFGGFGAGRSASASTGS